MRNVYGAYEKTSDRKTYEMCLLPSKKTRLGDRGDGSDYVGGDDRSCPTKNIYINIYVHKTRVYMSLYVFWNISQIKQSQWRNSQQVYKYAHAYTFTYISPVSDQGGDLDYS